ncbi:MAG TPA: hypothetical protein VMU89_08390 [Thermomicrobiaceae bacterium]|nr:hypothetical protein [Thermomicrobiaceae bacterium]
MTYLFPDVSGDFVVWQQDCTIPTCPAAAANIQAKNLVTGQQDDVANGSAPRISGTRVLYVSVSGANLMLRDLATMAPPTVVATVPSGWSIQDPRIDGDRIAWAETQGVSTWRIVTTRIGETPTQVARGTTMGFGGIGLAGDELVYVQGPTSIVADDLATGTLTRISANPYDQDVTTNGHYVFWSTFGPATNANDQRRDIVGYDLQTGSAFTVVQNAGWNGLPATGGDLVTWMHGQPPSVEIHATSISDVLPSAPQPNPATTSSDWLYFPETQHYLSFGFKDFWLANGGLPVFGYPMTEEFSELNPDQGKLFTVQYTERQRFEYHPELSGTPYEVELGRLGAEDAAARHLTTTAPFQLLSPTTGSDANCTFFKGDGLSRLLRLPRLLAGARAGSWAGQHGLPAVAGAVRLSDLGGVHGPQTGLVTQYFERAVFEYHPNNPDPYKVELRRLGADLLAQRGW